jgi:hypothetical protein
MAMAQSAYSFGLSLVYAISNQDPQKYCASLVRFP